MTTLRRRTVTGVSRERCGSALCLVGSLVLLTGMRLLRVSCVLVWRGICGGLRSKLRLTCCQEIAHRFRRWRGVMSMAAATSAALWIQALENVYRKDAPMTKKHALLVYPAFATSFWSFKFALQYLGKKSS